MSKSEYERAWGTAGWLEDHEFGAAGAVQCQRKTKTYEDVAESLSAGRGMHVKSVFRQRRDDGDLCAAFLWGEGGCGSQQSAFSALNATTRALRERGAEFACVTSFTYDYPSGYWQALVVFKRKEAK